MATIDLMDRFGNLGHGGIKNNGVLDAEVQFQLALRTMRTDFIQVKAGDSIVYKNMNGMASSWNILSFYTAEAQGSYVSGIAGQTTPQSGVWTAAQDGYVRLFGSFPAGDKISVMMTDLAPDVEDYLTQYDAMNYRFLPNSIPKIVAHIQEYLSNHPIADSTTLQAVIDAAFQSYMEEIQQTADTYIAEAVPPAAAAAVDAAASPALQEITAKAAEAAESARQAGLSQQSAEMSEENALTYRNQAQQIKESITAEVAASVQAAQEQATLAQESAQAADQSADTAEQFVAQARAQAEAAADHAQTASGYASDAQGYMQDASGYAQNASDFADNAAQSAATFSTDPTLTISGKAADAKVTGDELSALKSAIAKLGVNDNVYVQPEWEQGDINISNYNLDYSSTSQYYCRMVEGSPAVFLNGTVIRVKDPVYLFSYYYSGTGDKWYAQANKTEYTVSASTGNLVMTFSVRRTDWKAITPEEAANAIEIILPFNPYNMRNEEYYKLFALNDALIMNGIFWTVNNGLSGASTNAKVSSFIPVLNGQTIKYNLSVGGTGNYVICIYDSGFKFVSGVENTGVGTLTFTADGYIRICCLNDYAGYVYFDYPIPDKIQVEFDEINRTLVADVTGTDYMQTALARITGELKAKSVLGNIVTIGFSTDQHIKDDDDATATLPVLRGLTVLSKLTQAYPYDFVCLGGDACEAGAYATTIERILDECVTVQKPLHDAWCPVIPITGNHDAAQNNANITGEMLFNAHFKRIANSGFLAGWDSTHTNGYWDSDTHKIRFIFFDDTTRNDYSSAQRSAALSAMVNGTPDEYKIVIFSHHPLSQSLSDSHWQNPVYADEILIPYAGRIICCICGHSHADISETQNGILYIATTLAMYGHDQDGNRGAINTEQETAFDTFVIDQTNKHIYAIRYGHGNNRDWTYTVD